MRWKKHNLFRDIGKAIRTTLFPKREVQIGDYVQWECNGAYQFEKPRKVLDILHDDTGKQWALVEETTTGLPVEQLILEQPE